jgi:hypothetical protein
MPVKMKNNKDYYTVVERMDMLLQEVGRENYSLETDVTYESGIVMIKCTLTLYSIKQVDDDKLPVVRTYTGNALGELGKAKTLEATETHAVGRALSAAGWFGSEFASANEMESYQANNTTQPNTTKSSSSSAEIKHVISFGKYNGKEWKEIDEDYVKFIAGKSKVEWQRDEANKELQRRNKDKASGGSSEQSRLNNSNSYSDKDEINFGMPK